ncbi:MAG: TRAP transporter TatT component family protein [Myxococcota bacterium]
MNQNDLATVRDGAPAYLLLVDGLIGQDPRNQELLLAGASLYGAYASAFVDEPERAERLALRSLSYGRRALCERVADLCLRVDGPFREFAPMLQRIRRSDVPALYGFAAAWAGWVQASSDDWGAVAEIPKIEAALERVVELDESYDGGAAHLYLGVLATLLPPSLGGKTEQGRRHFERAIELSESRNLMAKVLYARHYARLVFDRVLHDKLLNEVLAADPETPGLVLSNTLAKQQAGELLDSADDYF